MVSVLDLKDGSLFFVITLVYYVFNVNLTDFYNDRQPQY